MKIMKFKPILKQTIWGGNRIKDFKHIADAGCNVGESWELSDVDGNESVADGGEYDGMTLRQIIEAAPEKILGRENSSVYGARFPLLVKFIDAEKALSIQVHPDDATARRHGHQRGKTEMWYLIDAAPGAKILSGLSKSITPDEYKAMVADDTICDAISQHDAKAGDCYFIPAGRIHSIGAGCFLVEIQQTSDVTYRIYDFKRKDKDGNCRQLHTELAAEAIDYSVESDYRTRYAQEMNAGVPLVDCPYFSTAIYNIDEPMEIDYSELDSFVILVALEGEGTLTDEDGDKMAFRAGDTVLLPASADFVKVEGTLKFLEAFA